MAQFKVSLDSGKYVVLREFTVKLKNQAVEAAGLRTSSASSGKAFEATLQDEILKVLIVSVNGQSLKAAEREDLDTILTYSEYQQLMMAVGDVMGGMEQIKKPKIEMITSDS